MPQSNNSLPFVCQKLVLTCLPDCWEDSNFDLKDQAASKFLCKSEFVPVSAQVV